MAEFDIVDLTVTDRPRDEDVETPAVETTDGAEREVIRDAGAPTTGGDTYLAELQAANPVTPPPIPQTRAQEGRWAGVSFEPVAGGNAVVAEQAVALGGADPADAVREFVTVARAVADGDEVEHGTVEDPELDAVTGEQFSTPDVVSTYDGEGADVADADGDGQSNDDNVPIDAQG